MHENLQRHALRLGAELRQLAQGEFPRQDRPRDAKPPRKGDPFRRSQRHLRRGVDGKTRREFPRQRRQPDVLHNGGVNPRAGEKEQLFLRERQFVGKNQRVEGGVALHAMFVQKRHQLREVVLGEIRRPHPRVERREPEIDRVGAVCHRRADAFPVARRSQKLRLDARRDFN